MGTTDHTDPFGATCFTTLRNFGTDRVRVGFDVNGWLLFGTAGVGYGQVNSGQKSMRPHAVRRVQLRRVMARRLGRRRRRREDVRAALVGQGRVPALRSRHKVGYTPTIIGGAVNVNVLERGDMVRAGINYKFDWAVGPVVARY
jgi:opacity protein-like surface antigen